MENNRKRFRLNDRVRVTDANGVPLAGRFGIVASVSIAPLPFLVSLENGPTVNVDPDHLVRAVDPSEVMEQLPALARSFETEAEVWEKSNDDSRHVIAGRCRAHAQRVRDVLNGEEW